MFNIKKRLNNFATLQPGKKLVKSLNIFTFEGFVVWVFAVLVLGPTIMFFSLLWLVLVKTEISGPLICLPVGILLTYFGYRFVFRLDNKYYFEGFLERTVFKILIYISPITALFLASMVIYLKLNG